MTKPLEILESEDVFADVTEASIDREKGIIRGVKLLGLRSKNKRNYDTPGVRKSAMEALKGAQVFIDHPAVPSQARSYRDMIGVVGQTVTFLEGKGHFGDIHYNPKHPVAEQFLWDVQNASKSFGMSVNAVVKTGKVDSLGDTAIEEVQSARSVDIVTKPATTAGIFEHEEERTDMDLETLKKQNEATEAELANTKKAHQELMDKLNAMESERAAEKLKGEVTSEFTKILEGTELADDVRASIVECACEMQESTRKKFAGVISKISPMLIETPDDDEDNDDVTPAKEEVEEQVKTPAPRKPQQKTGKFDIASILG